MSKKFLLPFITLIIAGLSCNKSNPVGPGSSGWTQCQGLPNNLPVTGFAASGNNLVAGTYNALLSQAYIYISADNGSSWSLDTTFHTNNHGPGTHYYVGTPVTLFSENGYIFAGIAANSGNVYLSTNNGVTWVEKDTNFIEGVNCFTSLGGTIFAGTNGVFKSTDYGTSWNPVSTGMSYPVSGLAVVGSNIFACTEGEGIYRSSDLGANWNGVNTTPFDFHSLVVIGTDLFTGFPGGYSNGGVLKSTDNGTS